MGQHSLKHGLGEAFSHRARATHPLLHALQARPAHFHKLLHVYDARSACRSRVLLALPNLRSLDGRPVGDGERAAAAAAVTAEEAVMTVLLRNACEVHKMVRGHGQETGPHPAAIKLHVHARLAATMCRFCALRGDAQP